MYKGRNQFYTKNKRTLEKGKIKVFKKTYEEKT